MNKPAAKNAKKLRYIALYRSYLNNSATKNAFWADVCRLRKDQLRKMHNSSSMVSAMATAPAETISSTLP